MKLIDAEKLKECAVTVQEVGVADVYAPRCPFSAVPMRMINALPAVEMPRWIPMTERTPDKAKNYLCVVCEEGYEPYVDIIWWNDEHGAFGHEATVFDLDTLGFVETTFEKWNVTHWMSLPEPPEVE